MFFIFGTLQTHTTDTRTDTTPVYILMKKRTALHSSRRIHLSLIADVHHHSITFTALFNANLLPLCRNVKYLQIQEQQILLPPNTAAIRCSTASGDSREAHSGSPQKMPQTQCEHHANPLAIHNREECNINDSLVLVP